MKRLSFILLLFVLVLVLFNATCKKPRLIQIETGTVSNVTDNAATVQGEIVDLGEGISEYGHCWSISPNPTIESPSKTNVESQPKVGSFNSELNNLANGTQYYVRAYATNGNEPPTYGDDEMFSTESYSQPTVQTSSVSSFSTTSATVGGEVISNGGASVAERGIYWGSSENPRSTGTKLAIGSGIGSFSDELTGLNPGTPYYVDAYAINNMGTGYGGEVNFTTNVEIVAPTVTTNQVTSIFTMSATVGGEVTQSGGATVTDRGIYWGTSTNPRSTGTKLSMGSGTGSFSEELTGLLPGTTYYVEAYAVNSAGNGYGDVLNYTTNTTPSVYQNFVYGGSSTEWAESIIQTSDGGFAIAGESGSDDGDITDPRGMDDYWVVKTYANGQIQWQKSLGGSEYDGANSIVQTSDGGYALAGNSRSNDRDVSGNHGMSDFWVVKLNSNGDLQWQNSLGGSDYESAESIIQTSDGGYAVAGSTRSSDFQVSVNYGYEDYWVVKLNSNGDLLWEKSLGGTSFDNAESIIQTSDGGYVVAGSSSGDYWVVKLDSNGEMLWEETFGGTNGDVARSIIQTSDGGYAIAGESSSNDGNVSGNHGSSDFWIVKLDSYSNLQWQKSYGGTNGDNAYSIIQASDGGYAIAGYSYSSDGNATVNQGNEDYWVIKLDANGDLQWEKSIGGGDQDRAHSIIQAIDGSYVVTGWYCSDNISFNGDYEVYILK